MKVVIFLFVMSAAVPEMASQITLLDSPYEEDATHQYFVELVEFIAKKSADRYGEANVTMLDTNDATHEKTLNLIRSKHIDLSWAGTSNNIEKVLLPVRIPLLGGLLGYRVSIIKKSDKNKFLNASTADFKKLVACQGADWGDSDILEDNGFSVMRISRFDLMFKMLDRGRCDYFPRAIFEGYNELDVAIKKYPNLMMMDDVILHYTFPLYFFVENHNTLLSERLTYGLKIAIEDGSFIRFIQSHPLTAKVFPIDKWKRKRFIELENHYLPTRTPVNERQLWIQLQSGQ